MEEDKIRVRLAHYQEQMEKISKQIKQKSIALQMADMNYEGPYVEQHLNTLIGEAEVLTIRIDTLEDLLR